MILKAKAGEDEGEFRLKGNNAGNNLPVIGVRK
jgi:hypothetical protein